MMYCVWEHRRGVSVGEWERKREKEGREVVTNVVFGDIRCDAALGLCVC